jgi:3-hydroxyacyl-CoA dehydrogenase
MPTIAIVGAGLIGRAWAIVFARGGWEVRLTDPSRDALESAPRLVREGLQELKHHGLADDPGFAADRVSVMPSLEEALAGVDLVQESGPETVDAKRAIFAELDRHAPREAILASSTSFIVASRFTEDLPGRDRCLIAHPVNPPHLVPIVELCPAPWTSPEVVERAREYYASVDQVPVHVRKEAFGFVLNRLQAVLMAEAFRLVGDGVVSPEDLDKTIRDGLGLRWAFMGPFETIELNAPGGIPDYCTRYAASLGNLVADAIGPEPFSARNVEAVLSQWPPAEDEADRVSRLTEWRDRRLAALAAHKRAAPKKPE